MAGTRSARRRRRRLAPFPLSSRASACSSNWSDIVMTPLTGHYGTCDQCGNALVFALSLLEQRADGFLIGDPAHGLGQQVGNSELANLTDLFRCLTKRN